MRRWDAENVDLNRNFLLPDETYAGAPDGYHELAPLLNPTGPPVRLEVFPWQALVAIVRHGLEKLKATTAVGQYDVPTGLFYGGHAPAATARMVQAHWADWIGDSPHVVHLDLHTGLGKFGEAKLLLVEPPDSPRLGWYAEHFGGDLVEPLQPTGGTAYAARGGMGTWLCEQFKDRNYRFLVAEIGTYRVLRVFAALRAENRAYHWLPPDDLRRKRAQRELVECFCPARSRWRSRVLRVSAEIIEAAQRAAMSLSAETA